MAAALTEILSLGLAMLAGTATVFVLMWLGALPQDFEASPWGGIVAGPILMGTAGACYLLIEQTFSKDASKRAAAKPLVPRGRRRDVFGSLGIAVVCIVVALAGSSLLGWLQELVLSSEVEEQQVIMDLVARRDPFELTVLAVCAVVAAPITEELVFRHMLFRRLHNQVPLAWALLIPSVAFALAHWNPVGTLVYMWLGLVFAGSYLLTGRLWVAILVHAGHNATAVALLLWLPQT